MQWLCHNAEILLEVLAFKYNGFHIQWSFSINDERLYFSLEKTSNETQHGWAWKWLEIDLNPCFYPPFWHLCLHTVKYMWMSEIRSKETERGMYALALLFSSQRYVMPISRAGELQWSRDTLSQGSLMTLTTFNTMWRLNVPSATLSTLPKNTRNIHTNKQDHLVKFPPKKNVFSFLGHTTIYC